MLGRRVETMSESAARTYISHAAEALKGQGANISPAEKC